MTVRDIREFCKLTNIATAIMELPNASWEVKYDLLFPEIIRKVHALKEIEFTYYDPDTSYEEDARAFVSALQHRADQLRPALALNDNTDVEHRAFVAGFDAARWDVTTNPEQAYRWWAKQHAATIAEDACEAVLTGEIKRTVASAIDDVELTPQQRAVVTSQIAKAVKTLLTDALAQTVSTRQTEVAEC